MEERNLSLQVAHKLNDELLASPSKTQEDFAGWPEVAQPGFRDTDTGRRP